MASIIIHTPISDHLGTAVDILGENGHEAWILDKESVVDGRDFDRLKDARIILIGLIDSSGKRWDIIQEILPSGLTAHGILWAVNQKRLNRGSILAIPHQYKAEALREDIVNLRKLSPEQIAKRVMALLEP